MVFHMTEKPKLEAIKLSSEAASNLRFRPCSPAFDKICIPDIALEKICVPDIEIEPRYVPPAGPGCSVCHVCSEPPIDLGDLKIDPEDFRKITAENKILKAQNIALEKRVTALESKTKIK